MLNHYHTCKCRGKLGRTDAAADTPPSELRNMQSSGHGSYPPLLDSSIFSYPDGALRRMREAQAIS